MEPTATAEELPLEALLERLAKLVEQLERGDQPLERSLALFEEGVRLARAGQGRLDAAEARIEQLLSVEPDGTVKTQPLAAAPGPAAPAQK